MFDQMIFPIVMPVMPLRLEEMLTRSSGAEVPNQTIVSPMIIFDMLAFLREMRLILSEYLLLL